MHTCTLPGTRLGGGLVDNTDVIFVLTELRVDIKSNESYIVQLDALERNAKC